MMLHYRLLLTLFIALGLANCIQSNLTNSEMVRFDVHAQNMAAIPVEVIMVGEQSMYYDEALTTIAQTVAHDINFLGNCTAAVRSGNFSKQELARAARNGASLVLFVKDIGSKIGWFIYDVSQTAELARGFCAKQGSCPRGWAHSVADEAYAALSGKSGFFSTKIVYCKQIPARRSGPVKYICVADYDGSHEQVLVSTPKLNLAPRWNKDPHNPLVFFSESGIENTRLCWVDMKRRIRGQRNDEGLSMQISFSGDGLQAVYCASRGTGLCQLYQWKNGILKRLTDNIGNNISPSFADDGTHLVFCSDCPVVWSQDGKHVVFCTEESEKKEPKRPQIYWYDLQTDQISPITTEGFCVSPAYHQKQGKIVYSKLIKGVLQLMLYDCKTKQHTQLTNDAGDKQEASWSGCGNYLIFAMSNGLSSRLAMLDLDNVGRYHYITADSRHYSYPHWSGQYCQFPVVS